MKKILGIIFLVILCTTSNADAKNNLNFSCVFSEDANDNNWSNIVNNFKFAPLYNKGLFYYHKKGNEYSAALSHVDKTVLDNKNKFEFYYSWGEFFPTLTYRKTTGKGPHIVLQLLLKFNSAKFPEWKGQYLYKQEFYRITNNQLNKLVNYEKIALEQNNIDDYITKMKHIKDTILVWGNKSFEEGKIEHTIYLHCKNAQ